MILRSVAPHSTDDTIEVFSEVLRPNSAWGRVRIQERQGVAAIEKCSVLLTPDQLEAHAHECLAIAAEIRKRRKPQ